MKFPKPITTEWMASFLSAEMVGKSNQMITGINEIHVVESGDLVFVDHPKYYTTCLQSAADFIIINSKEVEIPEGKMIFYVADPFEAYLKIVQHFHPITIPEKELSEDALIGEGTFIMPQVFIGKNVRIGKDCIIHPQVTILDDTQIGDRVIIQSGTVIGSDAFYYNTKKNRPQWYKKMLSCGGFIFFDDVVI
jgi:UDP-3-O-[3-hydroxymyristoyl] glucosamine N-acyltransferase